MELEVGLGWVGDLKKVMKYYIYILKISLWKFLAAILSGSL